MPIARHRSEAPATVLAVRANMGTGYAAVQVADAAGRSLLCLLSHSLIATVAS